jgi:hypothetical protein
MVCINDNAFLCIPAQYGSAASLIGIIFSGCNKEWSLVCLILSVTMQGAAYPGFLSNHLDLAPNFAGI